MDVWSCVFHSRRACVVSDAKIGNNSAKDSLTTKQKLILSPKLRPTYTQTYKYTKENIQGCQCAPHLLGLLLSSRLRLGRFKHLSEPGLITGIKVSNSCSHHTTLALNTNSDNFLSDSDIKIPISPLHFQPKLQISSQSKASSIDKTQQCGLWY